MQIQQNISLKPHNTFGIHVFAQAFANFNSVETLIELIDYTSTKKKPLLILGGGSNILFTKDFDGLVLKNELSGIELLYEDEHCYYVKAAAGVNWHSFVQYCLQHNYVGVENLSLIPGSVGASPIQNIGAYGVEIKDVFYELEAYHIEEKCFIKFSLNDCAFGYRESVFKQSLKNKCIITSVTYKLQKQPTFNISYGAIEQELTQMGVTTISIQAIAQAVINIRNSKLPNPSEIGNAGSFFKNPTISAEALLILKNQFPTIPHYTVANTNNQLYKIAAGWLIEQCGWKGYRKNDAGCYAKQALVLVNYHKASGEEIFDLSEAIIQSVQKKFALNLEREVNIF
jgi:UDP-N-acetylmuramate dehydrogenase